MKVHVIEDEEALLEAIKIALERSGHRVTTSADGMVAVADVLKNHPDVVLVDILLPGKNGFEIMQELRVAGFKNELIVLTNSNTADFDHNLLTELGVKDVLIKASISLSDILAAIESNKK